MGLKETPKRQGIANPSGGGLVVQWVETAPKLWKGEDWGRQKVGKEINSESSSLWDVVVVTDENKASSSPRHKYGNAIGSLGRGGGSRGLPIGTWRLGVIVVECRRHVEGGRWRRGNVKRGWFYSFLCYGVFPYPLVIICKYSWQ